MSLPVGQKGANADMVHGEADDDYHASGGISASGMKLFHELPASYWAKYIQPDPEAEEDEEEKEHFLIGKAGHCYVLEPDRFDQAFVEMPDGIDRRTRDGKDFWREFQEQNRGARILKHKSMRIAVSCANAMLVNPVGAITQNGQGIVETSIRWKQEVVCRQTGEILMVERKARPDIFFPPGALKAFPYGLIIDLKFVSDASPEGFEKEADKFGYYIQAPWYQDAIMQFYGTDVPPPFIFLCAEKKYPWIVQPYNATPEFIAQGRSIIDRRLPEFAKCIETGEWPAYSDGKVLPLKPNKYTYRKEIYRE